MAVKKIEKVTFKSDRVSLNLLDMVLNNSKHIQKHGQLQSGCRETMSPVTFTSPDAYIPINTWRDYPRLRSFSLEFQTNENYGILAYALGPEPSTKSSPLASYKRDFFALEIHNRFLLAYFNLGGATSYIRHEIVHEPVSTGRAHQITVEINENYALFR